MKRADYIAYAKKDIDKCRYNVMRLFAIFDEFYPRRAFYRNQGIAAKTFALIRQDRLDDIERGEE